VAINAIAGGGGGGGDGDGGDSSSNYNMTHLWWVIKATEKPDPFGCGATIDDDDRLFLIMHLH